MHLGRKRRRRPHKLGLGGTIAGELHDAPHGRARRDKVRYLRIPEQRLYLRGLAALEPACQDRLRRAELPAFRNGLHGGFCGIHGRGERGWHIHHQHRIRVSVAHDFDDRGAVAVRAGIADDVDGVAAGPRRGQDGVERSNRLGLQGRERPVHVRKRIGGQNAGSAPIRDDGKAVAPHTFHPRDHLRQLEHLVQVENAQNARASERCGEDMVGAGKCACVRKRGLGALWMAAGLDRDHGLGARAAPGRGHEFRRMRNALDIEKDRAAHDLAREVIQHVAQVHIRRVADGDDMAEANAFHCRPVEHRRCQRARLRHKRDIAAFCEGLREACIEVQIGHLYPQAVRADDAQKIGPRRLAHLLGKASRNACRYHHGGPAALAAKLSDDTGHCMRGSCHHAKLRHEGQALAGRVAGLPQNAGAVEIHKADLAREARPKQVLGDMQSDGAGPLACADQRYAFGLEQEIEIPDGHGNAPRIAPLHGTRR